MLPVYDLHCHSNCSDGILPPQDVVSRAHENGVTHLALTDHDTVNGIASAQDAAAALGITLIPGVEFSTLWRGRGIHIVGLNIDISSPELCYAIEIQRKSRIQRAKDIGQKLADKGIEGAYDGALNLAQGAAIGRPHFAQYLVEVGACSNVGQAFKRYLGAGKVGDVKQCWPDIDTAIAWIHKAGGVAVLAHPAKYDMTRTKLRLLLEEFKDAGGDAMEVICGLQKPGLADDMQKLANKYSLASSCGSDFHAPGHKWQELGKFTNLPECAEPVWELWAE